MHFVKTAAEDGKPHKRPTNIPSMEQINRDQIYMLIGILQGISPYLIRMGHGPVDPGTEIDKEAAISASTTAIAAFDKLTDILHDKKRWNTSTYDGLTETLRMLYYTQALSIQENNKIAAHLVFPSSLLKPEISRQKDGTWLARYGKGPNALMGRGNTPDEAVRAFNMAYYNLQEDTKGTDAAE